MAKNNKNNKAYKGVAMAAGVAAAAAAGAGAYYLLGPNKKEHQRKLKALGVKMKKEVIEEAKKAKDLTGPVYHRVVDTVTKTYAKHYNLHEDDVKAIVGKLKEEWVKFQKSRAGSKASGVKKGKVSPKKRTAKKASSAKK